jgi:hypothetical protein
MQRNVLIALVPALFAAALVAVAIPTRAAADDGASRGDVRVTRSCTAKSRAELRVRAREHDELRVDLELRTSRRGAPWMVVIVHERQLVFRGSLRTSQGSGTLSVRRTIQDWFGEDALSVRATGPGGETCGASATIRDD